MSVAAALQQAGLQHLNDRLGGLGFYRFKSLLIQVRPVGAVLAQGWRRGDELVAEPPARARAAA